MKLTAIALVLCACVWTSAADVAHFKAGKAKLIGRLAHGKHHKRGVLSPVPPFKLGHDIPRVTHSVVKPVVVTYPPAAAVTAVKVPLSHPLLPRYPVGVGHKVPHLPHPHYGLRFPHHTKSVVVQKPEHYFHHHHHHVEPRPVVPVVPAAPLPVPAPTIARPIPLPSPPVIVPQPSPLPPPVHILPPNHLHLRPIVPAAPVFPAAPAPVIAPAFSSFAPQFPYVLRPGGAVQSSVFATYPRYPFGNYPTPLVSASAFSQIVPHQYLVPQGDAHDGVVVGQQGAVPGEPAPPLVHAHGEVPQHGLHLHPGQADVHFQSAQPGIHFHPGQADIHYQPVQPDVHLHSAQPELHLQPGGHSNGQPEVHFQPAQPEFSLQPGQSEYHFQSGHTDGHLQPGQPDFHFQAGHTDVHLQPQPDYHLQPGQADVHSQPDFHLQPTQPDYSLQPNQPGVQPTVDSDGWSPVPAQPGDGGPTGAHYPADGYHYTQEQGHQVFEQHSGAEQQYHDYQHHIQQQIEQAQYEQHAAGQHQPGGEYGAPQEYNYQQPGAEGRSAGGEAGDPQQRYHNHIPLGLQPPIDRPLDHFR